MSERSIYLDFAATTPMAPEVVAAMQTCYTDDGVFANPASSHAQGRKSAAAIANARTALASLLSTDATHLIWTSGATESNNLCIQGVARARAHRGKHLITMPTEHKSVVDTFRALERQGFSITWLQPTKSGRLEINELESAIRDDTVLVSVMHINNETGVVHDLDQIGTLCRDKGVLFHTDAAQSVGKLDIDLSKLPVDLLSLCAHKFYGPQGIGALYVGEAAKNQVSPLLFGGGHERGLRPGTLPVHLIVGLGAAAELAKKRMHSDMLEVRALNRRLWAAIKDVPGLIRNGPLEDCYPGILNVSVEDIEGESLMLGLEPVCVASGAACNSTTGESSTVLKALGRTDAMAQSAVRFSFGRTTNEVDIDAAAERYLWAVSHLRAMLPAARVS